MTIDKIEHYKIPNFQNHKLVEFLDFDEIPTLFIEKDTYDNLYLSYLNSYPGKNVERRILIKITLDRLRDLNDGDIFINYAYHNPEFDNIYIVDYAEDTGKVIDIYCININNISLEEGYFAILDNYINMSKDYIFPRVLNIGYSKS